MAKEYGKVSPQFWTGRTGRAIRGDADAQIVAMYLMTCEHGNMIGVFRIPMVFVSHDTGRDIKGAWKGLGRLIEAQFCSYDEETEYVWIHNMASWQLGDSLSDKDKRVKSIQKQVDLLPNLPFLKDFYEKYSKPFHIEITHDLEGACKGLQSPIEASSSSSSSNKKEPSKDGSKKTVPRESKSTSRKTKLPEGFSLNDKRRAMAVKYWKDRERNDLVPRCQEIFDQFITDAKAKGKSFVDWDAAWTTWYSNAVKFERVPYGTAIGQRGAANQNAAERSQQAIDDVFGGSGTTVEGNFGEVDSLAEDSERNTGNDSELAQRVG